MQDENKRIERLVSEETLSKSMDMLVLMPLKFYSNIQRIVLVLLFPPFFFSKKANLVKSASYLISSSNVENCFFSPQCLGSIICL